MQHNSPAFRSGIYPDYHYLMVVDRGIWPYQVQSKPALLILYSDAVAFSRGTQGRVTNQPSSSCSNLLIHYRETTKEVYVFFHFVCVFLHTHMFFMHIIRCPRFR